MRHHRHEPAALGARRRVGCVAITLGALCLVTSPALAQPRVPPEPPPAELPGDDADEAPGDRSDDGAGVDRAADHAAADERPAEESPPADRSAEAPPAPEEPPPLPPVRLEADQDDLREAEPPPEEEIDDAFDQIDDISDLDLEALLRGEVVTSYSRAAERVEEAPVSITVVTRAQMLRWGYQTVAELLQRVVGFYVQDDHVLPNVAVRGITGGLRAESGLLKVMVDGVPISFRPTGGNWLGAELIPMSAVERVEIIRGPTSTVYGADAFLATINVITREGNRVNGGEVWTTGNYTGGIGGGLELTMGGQHGQFRALASVRLSREDRSGLRLPASSPRPRLRLGVNEDQRAENLILDAANVFLRLSYDFDDDNSITVTGQFAAIDRNADFADWLQLASGLDDAGRQRGNQISLMRGFVNVSGRFRPEPHLSLTTNVRFLGGQPTDGERIDINSDVTYVRRQMDFNAGLADVALEWTPIQEVRLVGGVDFLFDHETLPGIDRVLLADSASLRAGDVLTSESSAPTQRDFINTGVFLLLSANPVREIRLDGGLRYDYNNIYGNQLNGRVGGTARIIDELIVKLNYASAFRAPTSLLLYGQPFGPGDIAGNASLRPQQIHTVEGTVTVRPWSWVSLDTGVSYNLVLDKAAFVQEGINNVARNLANLEVVAWETRLSVDWEEQLYAYANYAFVFGQRDQQDEGYRASLTGSGLEVYPEHMLNAGVAYQLPEEDFPLRVTVEGRFIGERRASDLNVIENGSTYTLPAAFYLDASVALVGVQLFPERDTTLMFSVRNILNEQAAHPGFGGVDYPSVGRSYMLQWQQQL